jgi:hypothetical protein
MIGTDFQVAQRPFLALPAYIVAARPRTRLTYL